jgi:hypothetical protein
MFTVEVERFKIYFRFGSVGMSEGLEGARVRMMENEASCIPEVPTVEAEGNT